MESTDLRDGNIIIKLPGPPGWELRRRTVIPPSALRKISHVKIPSKNDYSSSSYSQYGIGKVLPVPPSKILQAYAHTCVLKVYISRLVWAVLNLIVLVSFLFKCLSIILYNLSVFYSS